MILKMILPKIETKDLLLSFTKKCEMIFKQTHRKAEETLECKMIKPRETFHSNPPIPIEGSWMIGLKDLGVYNSLFEITEENNEFELYTDTCDHFSFEELKDELEEILSISDLTPFHLQHETI